MPKARIQTPEQCMGTCCCLWHPKPSSQPVLPSWALMGFPSEHTTRRSLAEGEPGEYSLGEGVNALSAIQLQTGSKLVAQGSDQAMRMFHLAYTG